MTDSSQQPGQDLPVISLEKIVSQSNWSGTLSSGDPLEREYRLNTPSR
jgi:hypothetical protein